MFFGHDLKLQTGFTETSEPVLIIFPFSLVLIRLKVFRVVNPVAKNFERNFHFRNFRIFHRWTIGGPPVGKPSCNLIFPHRWPPVVHRWPLVGYHGLSVREGLFKKLLNITVLRNVPKEGKKLMQSQLGLYSKT